MTEHCSAVAELCRERLRQSGLPYTGYLCGLIHDMGKYTQAFATYLRRSAHGEAVARGSVNHTFAAVRLLWERYGERKQTFAVEILSVVVGSHHGQFDGISSDGTDGYSHRVNKSGIGYGEAKSAFFEECITEAELDELFEKAVGEIYKVTSGYKSMFDISMLCRLLLSVLIDADRTDTAAFMRGRRDFSAVPDIYWEEKLTLVEEKLKGFAKETPIDRTRAEFSRMCAEYPYLPSGIYRLDLPTGAGKTLASLRGALTYAKKYNKKRLIFVTPLLSVLEQNADVIHKYIGDESVILEHHSNVVQAENDGEALDKRELLQDAWDAPIIITTMVQLLNTLFDGRTSSIRRMCGLRDAVIIFDEVQSLPKKLLSCFNMAVNHLTEFMGSAVFLCSATQPCLEKAQRPLNAPHIIVPYDKKLWAPFVRTKYHFANDGEYLSEEELAVMGQIKADEYGSVLIICNKKDEARRLYRLLAKEDNVFHLSTSMCMAHRKAVLERITAALAAGKRTVCVSTQLVEAGIDISFGCVIRLFAGLDNVVQSAGRCNRHGEYLTVRPVYVVRLQGENLSHLPDIKEAADALSCTLAEYKRKHGPPECTDRSEVVSAEYVEDYYTRLFGGMKDGAQDYSCKAQDTTLFEMLTVNKSFRAKNTEASRKRAVAQAFKTAGECFAVFENMTTDVVVPYGEGAELIAELGSERVKHSISERKAVLDKLSQYTVSLFEHQIKQLEAAGGLVSYSEVLVVRAAFYDCEGCGICEDNENVFNEFVEG